MSPSRTAEQYGSFETLPLMKKTMSSSSAMSTDSCNDSCNDSSTDSELDSVVEFGSNSNNFFEGVEKLLEVWFTNKKGPKHSGGDLRKIPRECLDEMLQQVHCEVISRTRNSQVDAYILSESSMFVTKRRFILKTCGTTTTLECMHHLIKLAKEYSGFDVIEDIFYSRKNFGRPELQMKPYRRFEKEVTTLDQMFSDGDAFCMGSINHDCWYLYTLNPLERYLSQQAEIESDQTIEILMSELDPKVMEIFTKAKSANGREATKQSGIDKILPSMKIDDFLFDPCGYSMNGILQNESTDCGLGEYMTIHITPEPECSYVSFESNVPLKSYLGLIKRVLNTFKPGKFILTIFANRTSVAAESHMELQKLNDFGDWFRKDIQYSQFQNYELTYGHYVKFPS